MSDRKQSLSAILTGRMTAPVFLSTVLAVSIFWEQFLVVAGILAGAALILSIVRWVNPPDEPFREVLEIVLRDEAYDSAWVEELRQKHRDANDITFRTWRQYACGAWIVVAALVIKLGCYVFLEFFKSSHSYF